MKVNVIKLKSGVSFVQFGRTFGGNLRFTAEPTPGSPGSVVKDVTATARPDLSGILLETTLVNKFSGKAFNPYVIPFESVDGFEVDAESLAPAKVAAPVAADAPAEVVDEPAEPPAVEKRKPGRPPKAAAALALLFSLLGTPAYASDASTDKPSATASVIEKVRCIDGPGTECMTCVHPGTEQFQIVCGLPKKPAAKTPAAKKGK
mgnify:CR=1 FL=1